MLKRFDGPLATTNLRSDLIVGHITEELQRQHLLLIERQLADRLLKRHPIIDRKYRLLTARVDYLDTIVQRGRDRALAPRLADQHIIGDRIQPAQERFFATVLEPADAFDNANEHLLRQILRAFLIAHARVEVA